MQAGVMTARGPSPDVVTAGGSGERETVSSSVVEAARAGDADAFMVIYDAYATRLRGPAFRTLDDPDLVDRCDAGSNLRRNAREGGVVMKPRPMTSTAAAGRSARPGSIAVLCLLVLGLSALGLFGLCACGDTSPATTGQTTRRPRRLRRRRPRRPPPKGPGDDFL